MDGRHVSRETLGSGRSPVTARIADLQTALRALDGKGYPAYKQVRGSYAGPRLRFQIEHVQGDPFADPSRVAALIAPREAGFPEWAYRTRARRRASADHLNRRLLAAVRERSLRRGSGKSGEIHVLVPGQEVLTRTSVRVDGAGGVVARFRIGLPARGRRILGGVAADLVADTVGAVEEALYFDALDAAALSAHVETVEDAVALRSQLVETGLVAFVADGARLPRRSGVDDRPLEEPEVVPFAAPASLRRTLNAPNAGLVSGMGIPRGVTLIVGGGYHGKSTLLRAIERGVYDHVPGDGRERVVAVADAAKVRAEDGRRVAGTDISNFIGALPGGSATDRFHTENASGSTSQAASIVEALEAGASTLLLDEDTSATNFMIRDARMQRLIAAGDEPITPFIDRARALFLEAGVSTVVVIGGSGDYFDVADTVVAMRHYRPVDVTEEARRVAGELPSARVSDAGQWREIAPRHPDAASIEPRSGRRDLSIRILARDRLRFGDAHVDLAAVEQIVELAQTRAMAYAAAWARAEVMNGARTMGQVVTAVVEALEEQGLEAAHPFATGELAAFRGIELASLINRLPGLRTHATSDPGTVHEGTP
jgi:predicted ABC-class ATPase